MFDCTLVTFKVDSADMKAKDVQASGSKSWQQRLWRRERLHALGLTINDYDKYLETPHWKAFQKQVYEEQRRRLGHNRCERCPDAGPMKETLHVHHLTYERLGQELLSDVLIICRDCHKRIHGRDARGRARHYSPGVPGRSAPG